MGNVGAQAVSDSDDSDSEGSDDDVASHERGEDTGMPNDESGILAMMDDGESEA